MRSFLKLVLIVSLVVVGISIIGAMASNSASRPVSPVSAQIDRDTAAQSCTAADFSLSKLKANREYDYAKLTGIVTSHCASAAGVQLKWTAFNSDGTVAFSSDFWPASTTNIPPHTDYPFEMMEAAPRGKWTYRVEPTRVDVW